MLYIYNRWMHVSWYKLWIALKHACVVVRWTFWCIIISDALNVQQIGARYFVQYKNNYIACMRGSPMDINVYITTAYVLIVQQIGARYFVKIRNNIKTWMQGSRVDSFVCTITVVLFVFVCIACRTLFLLFVTHNVFPVNHFYISNSVF